MIRLGLTVALMGCACTSPGPFDSDSASDVDTDVVPAWTNPAWAGRQCDRSGPLEWNEKNAYMLPYRDGNHGLKVLFALEDDWPTDLFSVTWYAERGATVGPSVSFLSDESNDTAPVYAMILLRCDGACDRRFLATSGRVVVEEARVNGSDFRGYLDQVIFQEGTFDRQTQESEVWPDGEVWCLEHYRLDTELTTQPWRDR